jgi:hypothetical protein
MQRIHIVPLVGLLACMPLGQALAWNMPMGPPPAAPMAPPPTTMSAPPPVMAPPSVTIAQPPYGVNVYGAPAPAAPAGTPAPYTPADLPAGAQYNPATPSVTVDPTTVPIAAGPLTPAERAGLVKTNQDLRDLSWALDNNGPGPTADQAAEIARIKQRLTTPGNPNPSDMDAFKAVNRQYYNNQRTLNSAPR